MDIQQVLHALQQSSALDGRLSELLEAYRAHYLNFFLTYFEQHRRPQYKGGYFNINSVTGRPYEHHCCYSWTDGRSLGELSASWVSKLGPRDRLRAYADHLYVALRERYQVNGWFPHAVDDQTNRATDDPLNVRIEPDASSFSHIFVLNGLFQYGLAFKDETALHLARCLLGELRHALRAGTFLEGAAPRPEGHRAQGPSMIALGAISDVLETLQALSGGSLDATSEDARSLIDLGRECVDYILHHHYRPEDHAFWEVSQGAEAVRNDQGQVITDPGHTLEFTGFAARFSIFLEPEEGESLRETCRSLFLWAAGRGFHASRDLIYKNVDRDTGTPIKDATVTDLGQRVSPEVFQEHFGGKAQTATLSTFPWWVPMELLAAGSLLRHGDDSGKVDGYLLRAIHGLFQYYCNPRIDGLCYQNIGDEFFDYLDIPPATPTLDLMHSHRSLRIFLRECGCAED